MRHKDKVKRKWWIIGVVTPVLLLVALVNMPPLTPCLSSHPASDQERWFPATSVIVQPWRGQHHVYGIFIIPVQYKFDHLYRATLTIQGVGTELQAGSPEDEDRDGASPKAGFYTKRVYLSTRAAFRVLLRGGFGDLVMSCHWWLILTEKAR